MLRDKVNDNQERIDNLIETLNLMAEKSQQKEATIRKLEHKIVSLTHYHENCYSFSMQRIQDAHQVLAVLADHLESNSPQHY